MTCDKCPALIIESNESVYPPEFHCWYGDKYLDEHLECFANLNERLQKTSDNNRTRYVWRKL